MSFESHNNQPPVNPEVPTPAQKEKPSILRERARRLMKAGIIAGTLVLGGELARETIVSNEKYEKHKQEQLANPHDAQRYQNHMAAIRKSMGDSFADWVDRGDKRVFFETQVHGEIPEHPVFEGFEDAGVNPEVLKKIWNNETYPDGWVDGRIREIRYVDRKGGDRQTAQTSTFSSEISFVAGSLENVAKQREKLANLDYIFGHEIGHLNDWETARFLSLPDRAELLTKIIKRMQSPDAYVNFVRRFSGDIAYHEEVLREDSMFEDGRYRAAKEYWAELCADFFGAPDIMREDSPEDFALVASVVWRADSSFQPETAETLRKELIDRAGGGAEREGGR